jgi:hypothetical protein
MTIGLTIKFHTASHVSRLRSDADAHRQQHNLRAVAITERCLLEYYAPGLLPPTTDVTVAGIEVSISIVYLPQQLERVYGGLVKQVE